MGWIHRSRRDSEQMRVSPRLGIGLLVLIASLILSGPDANALGKKRRQGKGSNRESRGSNRDSRDSDLEPSPPPAERPDSPWPQNDGCGEGHSELPHPERSVIVEANQPGAGEALKQAMESAKPGTEIVIRGQGPIKLPSRGIEVDSGSGAAIVVRPENPSVRPVIDGSAVTKRGCIRLKGGSWVLSGLRISGCKNPSAGTSHSAIWADGTRKYGNSGANQVAVLDCELTNSIQGVIGWTRERLTIERNEIHHMVSASGNHGNGHGVYIYGGPELVMRYNNIHDNAKQGVHIRANRSQISYNYIGRNYYQVDLMTCRSDMGCGRTQEMELAGNIIEARSSGDRNRGQLIAVQRDESTLIEGGQAPVKAFTVRMAGNQLLGHQTEFAVNWDSRRTENTFFYGNNNAQAVSSLFSGRPRTGTLGPEELPVTQSISVDASGKIICTPIGRQKSPDEEEVEVPIDPGWAQTGR